MQVACSFACVFVTAALSNPKLKKFIFRFIPKSEGRKRGERVQGEMGSVLPFTIK
jgi:hypothetical protein